MKNIIFIILLTLSCNNIKPIQGYFYIKSETPVEIIYTNIIGIDEVITTDYLEVPFEIIPGINKFDYRISVYSETGIQTFVIDIFFDDNDNKSNFKAVIRNREYFIKEAIYYPPWNKSVKI